LLAIWLVVLHRPARWIHTLVRYLALWVLLSGLVLTFSRSAIGALVVSSAVFFAVRGLSWLWRPNARSVYRALELALLLAVVLCLINAAMPLVFDFFQWRLISYLQDSNAVSEDLSDPQSSGGARVVVVTEVIRFVLQHPLTGSGYLGVWALPNVADLSLGSAHNQYIDVLFRTGVAGFVAYACLLWWILRDLHRYERSLFWGFFAVLLYGMFHETFKEAHGGFVLAFLIGMLCSRLRATAPQAEPTASRDAPAHEPAAAPPG
jgi:O-antigen ligase